MAWTLRQNRRRRAAFLFFDLMIALAVLATLTTLMIVGVDRQRRTSQALSDTRAANRLAERVLLDLQQGHKPAAATGGERVAVARLTGGQEISGYSWVSVTVESNGRHATLSGLAKTAALENP